MVKVYWGLDTSGVRTAFLRGEREGNILSYQEMAALPAAIDGAKGDLS